MNPTGPARHAPGGIVREHRFQQLRTERRRAHRTLRLTRATTSTRDQRAGSHDGRAQPTRAATSMRHRDARSDPSDRRTGPSPRRTADTGSPRDRPTSPRQRHSADTGNDVDAPRDARPPRRQRPTQHAPTHANDTPPTRATTSTRHATRGHLGANARPSTHRPTPTTHRRHGPRRQRTTPARATDAPTHIAAGRRLGHGRSANLHRTRRLRPWRTDANARTLTART